MKLLKKMPFFGGVGNTPQKQQKRFTELEDGVLIRGSHYEHDTVDAKLVLKVFKEEVIPW